MTKEEYNDEPVVYCARCHSLRILRFGTTDLSYCDECGSTDMITAHITEYLKEINN